MRRYAKPVAAILWKDLLVELRSRERLVAMGAFAVLVAVLLNYAIDPTVVRPRDVAPGLIWMTVVFSGMLGFGRAFQMEQEQDRLQGMLLSPIPRGTVYLCKALANLVLLVVVEALVFGVFALFFNLSYGAAGGWLAGAVLLATVGFAALGTLFGAVAVHTRMSDTILPILVFPLLLPLVIHAVTATARLMAGRPVTEVEGNLRRLAAFALLFTFAGAAHAGSAFRCSRPWRGLRCSSSGCSSISVRARASGGRAGAARGGGGRTAGRSRREARWRRRRSVLARVYGLRRGVGRRAGLGRLHGAAAGEDGEGERLAMGNSVGVFALRRLDAVTHREANSQGTQRAGAALAAPVEGVSRS